LRLLDATFFSRDYLIDGLAGDHFRSENYADRAYQKHHVTFRYHAHSSIFWRSFPNNYAVNFGQYHKASHS
jgi:hypothetical protein